jgi:hypothetical protein
MKRMLRNIMCRKWKFTLLAALFGAHQLAFGLPDLVVNRGLLRTSVLVERAYFTYDDCNYIEGCVPAAGLRKLMRVDVGMANIGKGDLVIGSPEDRPDLFVWSPCHQHYHMKTMVKYRLLNLNYTKVTKARKQAFCLRDNYPYTSTAGASSGYTCGYQGITAGWEDVYDQALDCQYIDVTGVPPGQYYLEVTVNPFQVVDERDYYNNKVIVLVTIPYLPK